MDREERLSCRREYDRGRRAQETAGQREVRLRQGKRQGLGNSIQDDAMGLHLGLVAVGACKS